MANDFSVIVISDVDPVNRAINGKDEFGQSLSVTSQFLQPLTTVPQVGEKWLVTKQGNQWLLDRRWDGDDKFLDLQAGDVHLDAKNNLIITAAQKILVNGQELANNVKVSANDGEALTANSIKFRTSETVRFTTIVNEAEDSIDVWANATITFPPEYLPPTGTVNMFAGAAAPDGWLLCNGASLLRADYPDLFGVIDVTYGNVDSDHFTLPDMRGRMPVGLGTHTDVDALGENDGSAIGSRRPKHKHTASSSDSGHSHVVPTGGDVGGQFADGDSSGYTPSTNTGYANITTTVGPQTNVPTDGPAYLTLNFIIKI